MLIGFLDDTELIVDQDDPAPDIFVFGGYFIDQGRLQDFQNRISEIKGRYGLLPHAPVKWNLKDTGLRSFYKPENWLHLSILDHLLEVAYPLRCDLLSILGEFDAKIFISGRYDVARVEATRVDYYLWAFENLLQRVGLMAQSILPRNGGNISNLLVIDWPQGGVDKKLFDIYLGGYHYGRGLSTGQNYFSGALHNLQFADSLVHGSTYHSSPLQLADMVVGCCRDFLNWAIKGTDLGRIQGVFDLLIDRFYTDANGRIDGCGFKVAKANQLDVQGRIKEYLALGQQPPPEAV